MRIPAVRPRLLVVLLAGSLLLAACAGADDAPADVGAGTEDADEPEAEASDPDGVEASDGPAEPADDPDEAEAGEATGAEPGDATGADRGPALRVVTTVAPIGDLVRVVGGSRVEVEPLVPAGADTHTYEPRPRDVARLADADAYLGVGLGLNPGALRLAEDNLAEDVPIVPLGEVALTDEELVLGHTHDDEADDGHTHGDDEADDGHTHGDDEADDGHTHGDDEAGPNPHVWTSVRNASPIVDAIADALAELDPAGEADYRANAAQARDGLAALDRAIDAAVATIPSADRTLVTYHEAWAYFARDYGLEFVTAVQPTDLSDPSAAEVRDVIDLIRARDVPAVFGSEVFPTPVLEAIAEETDAVYVGDLADDVLPGQPGDPEHSYLELMRRNAVAIVDGLGGDTGELEELGD